MTLHAMVIDLLKKKRETFKWLSTEMGMTEDGLKYSLTKETLKFRDILRLAKILRIQPEYFLALDKKHYSINAGDNNLIANEGSSFFNESGKGGKSKDGFNAEITRLNTELNKCQAELIKTKDQVIALISKRK